MATARSEFPSKELNANPERVMRYTERDKYETRLHRIETMQELLDAAQDLGMKEGMIGQIHLCQRLLGQALTSKETLQALTPERLHAQAQTLETAVLAEREEKRQPLTPEQRARLLNHEMYLRDTFQAMSDYRRPADACIRKARTLLALYIRVWHFELNWLQSEYRRSVPTVADLQSMSLEALLETADRLEREVLSEIGCSEQFYLNWRKQREEDAKSNPFK
jgi:hypothetical protein